jgi:GTP-binding protein
MSVFQHAEFVRSVHDSALLPQESGVEIAFAGRSNAGKSTAINAIVQRKRLAYVSKTPGRTQSINYFSLGAERFLVDLPGYGYAAVSQEERRNWGVLISTYIQSRPSLRGLIVVMDIRRPFTPLDRQLLNWIAPLGKASHVLLTKADKLVKREAAAALRKAQDIAGNFPACSVQLFSGMTGLGVEEARHLTTGWFRDSANKKPPVKGE